MSAPRGNDRHNSQEPRWQNTLSPEILDILGPALQVGGLSGGSGMLVGAFAGVLRSSSPALFALASGVQWFTLGSTFWASRGFILYAWRGEEFTQQYEIAASAIAGGVGGAAGGLLRGRRNIIPGAIVFGLLGAIGQLSYSTASMRNPIGTEATNKTKSWLDSKWSPLKVLSDGEYEDMLREKLLGVNADIALVDESIVALRVEDGEAGATSPGSTSEKSKKA